MLDDTLKAQLAAYLERVTQPFEMVASLDDSETSAEMRSLLETIQSLRADKISLRLDGNDARKPSFSLQRVGSDTSLRFAGLPLGHEFTSLVLALLWTGGHPPKVEQDVIDQIKGLDGDFNFEVYMSLSCHNCPDVVQALSLMAINNPKIKTTVIEGGAFQQEDRARNHGRAHGLPQRAGIWLRPHAGGRNTGQDRHRCRRQRCGQVVTERSF